MASNAFLIALHGYNATTDTDPDHFALYADQATDHILIKEKARGTALVVTGGSGTPIAHGLLYVPFCLAFVEVSAGRWRKLYSVPLFTTGCWFEINNSQLLLHNTTGTSKNFAYQIFYDNIT